ncbi:MFS multidrug transporter [Aspergillus campestris IBT 28561]|uniref:MFS multidrug transporter n=1 Tax=Aspergillus campestris (strain IBT 28561) TaxID=1392248 RepID=A0A2I1CS65_ASPC2|nr:MFS multidrug transporter [Aspergillus campestris IBT 28561]PKY00464.1 MFS multidrug transporter [Aspergillus campestris IBT 28561]
MAAPAHLEWAHHPHNPYNWPPRKKWMCMLTSCWVTFIVGLNATSITTAAEPISRDFDLSNGFFEYNFFAVTAWNAAAAIVPLATLPLMETYGMRVGFVTSYILFTIFIIPQALAQNFATLVVCRAIAGAFGGTLQNSADGLASNIFLSHRERVFPLTLYVFTLVFGVTMGPVLGAAFQPLGWRWVFWIELIIYGAFAPIVVILMKESRGPILRARLFPDSDTTTKPTKSEAIRTFKETIVRSALLLTTEPTVTVFTLWSAFAFGLVFISTQSIPIVFSGTYNWPSHTDGLVQSAIGIGQILGLLLTTFYQNRLYTRSAAHNPEHPGTPIPEAILHLSIPSTAVALAGGLFMYGWSTEQTHWIVPAIALALIGYAIMVIVTAVSIYVTDSYAGYAASAIGAVAFGENIFAAFLPLAAKPMYLRLGYQWASSLLGFVAAVLTLAPVVLIWKGRAIRERSVAIRKMNIEGL